MQRGVPCYAPCPNVVGTNVPLLDCMHFPANTVPFSRYFFKVNLSRSRDPEQTLLRHIPLRSPFPRQVPYQATPFSPRLISTLCQLPGAFAPRPTETWSETDKIQTSQPVSRAGAPLSRPQSAKARRQSLTGRLPVSPLASSASTAHTAAVRTGLTGCVRVSLASRTISQNVLSCEQILSFYFLFFPFFTFILFIFQWEK